MKEPPAAKDDDGRAKLYADIAHPINSICREMIQQRVIQGVRGGEGPLEAAGLRAQLRRFRAARFDLAVRLDPPAPVTTQIQGAEKPRGPHKVPRTSRSRNGKSNGHAQRLRARSSDSERQDAASRAGIFE